MRCTIYRWGDILQERYIGEIWKASSDISLNYRRNTLLIWAIYRRDIVDISVIYRNNKVRYSMISVSIIYENIIIRHDLYPLQTTGKIKVKLFLIESNIAFIPEGAQNLPQTKFGIFILLLGPVVQRLDNAIHRINHYPAASVVCFANTYPLDSDLSGG